jgi:flagellar biosynthesis/type III secretory pathway protein FliH
VKSLSRDVDSNSNGPLLRVSIPARPAVVRVFEGSRNELVERRRRDVLAREFARGRAEGERAALSGAAAALNRAAEAIEQAAAAQTADVARDTTRLVTAIARTLLRREIDAGRYDIERIVRETLQASGAGRGTCVVHLNPADLARLDGAHFRAGTTLEADPEVPAGDVHVTTHRGLLVRDVEQALASITERLEGDVA